MRPPGRRTVARTKKLAELLEAPMLGLSRRIVEEVHVHRTGVRQNPLPATPVDGQASVADAYRVG